MIVVFRFKVLIFRIPRIGNNLHDFGLVFPDFARGRSMPCGPCEHVNQFLGQNQYIEQPIKLVPARCMHLRHTCIRENAQLEPGLSQEGFRLAFHEPCGHAFNPAPLHSWFCCGSHRCLLTLRCGLFVVMTSPASLDQCSVSPRFSPQITWPSGWLWSTGHLSVTRSVPGNLPAQI